MLNCLGRNFLRLMIFLILSGTGSSWAYLGGFEEDDGYRVSTSGNIASQNHVGDAQFYLQNNAGNGLTGIVPSATYPNNMGDNWHGPDVSRYNAGQYGWGVGGTATDIADNTGRWRALAGGRLNEDVGAPVYLGGEYQRDYISTPTASTHATSAASIPPRRVTCASTSPSGHAPRMRTTPWPSASTPWP
jgi:hypothetical protein